MQTIVKRNRIVACKLSGPELKKRKEEVLASLRMKVLEKKELPDGFEYQFNGSDDLLEELVQFIKTERVCCNFFTFELTVEDEGSPVSLKISGPEGAKEFITAEIAL